MREEIRNIKEKKVEVRLTSRLWGTIKLDLTLPKFPIIMLKVYVETRQSKIVKRISGIEWKLLHGWWHPSSLKGPNDRQACIWKEIAYELSVSCLTPKIFSESVKSKRSHMTEEEIQMLYLYLGNWEQRRRAQLGLFIKWKMGRVMKYM